MDHKKKCQILKSVRKHIADSIGVDLHQTECTYEGECRGTCAKCEQEEKILNRALLGGTITAASVLLTACSFGGTPEGNGLANDALSDRIEELKQSISDGTDGGGMDDLEGMPTIEPTGGEAMPPYDALSGDVQEQDPDDEMGDASLDITIDEDLAIENAIAFSGSQYAEVVGYEDYIILIDCYNLESDEDGNEQKQVITTIYVDTCNGSCWDDNGAEYQINGEF